MIVFALFIGITAGLRALAPVAASSWAAHLGWLQLQGTWLEDVVAVGGAILIVSRFA